MYHLVCLCISITILGNAKSTTNETVPLPTIFNTEYEQEDALKLKQYALRINNEPFDKDTVSDISHIYNRDRLTETYSKALPDIVQSGFNEITKLKPMDNIIGIKNYIQFMNLLHIKPMNIMEIKNPEFRKLNHIIQLLVISSRAIIHSYANTNIFDEPEEEKYFWIKGAESELYPWIADSNDFDCTMDMMKIVYFHVYNHVAKYLWTKPNKTESEYVTELIDDFAFVPWNDETTRQMTVKRDFTELNECYIEVTSILETFISDGQIDKIYDGAVGFNAHDDYERTK